MVLLLNKLSRICRQQNEITERFYRLNSFLLSKVLNCDHSDYECKVTFFILLIFYFFYIELLYIFAFLYFLYKKYFLFLVKYDHYWFKKQIGLI